MLLDCYQSAGFLIRIRLHEAVPRPGSGFLSRIGHYIPTANEADEVSVVVDDNGVMLELFLQKLGGGVL